MTVVSLCLLAVQMRRSHSSAYAYLVWNLFLAWLPLLLGVLIVRLLAKRLWSSWLPVVLTGVWLMLLPNSFYMISDYVHVQTMPPTDLLFNIVTFTAFIVTAAMLGFYSLQMLHIQLRRRIGGYVAAALVAIILFACSFAIYLGRDLRWNSWDIVLNPAGILFDVSDRIIHPLGHPGTLSITLSFFVLLGSLYVLGWQIGEATRQEGHGKRAQK